MLAAVATLAGTGCDESFSPIAPTDLQFSVFGYVDASADTQWIRVMPIRQLAVTTADSFGAAVTLEHLATGRTVELRDSLFLFTNYHHPDVGSEGIYVHNFWTTERIEPGASYRFEVRRNGGEPAGAVVEVPSDYDVEVWLRQGAARGTDSLHLAGVKHVPFVTSTTLFYDRCGSFSDGKPVLVRPVDGAVHTISIAKPSVPQREACGGPLPEKRELWVVGSEQEWPAGAAYSPSNLGVPEEVSNVSNSLGYLAGVLSKRVPYENCELLGPQPVPDHCRLRYDASTATITGTVTETRCGGAPFDSINVQLTELDASPSGHRRLRSVRTNRAGRYEISGLEAGKRHVLHPVSPTSPGQFGPVERYTQFTDTLVFTPGERRLYDIGLRKLDDCSVKW